MSINTFREHLTCFPNVKSFTFELVYEADVGAGEQLGRDVDGTHLAAGTVAGEGSTGGGGRTRAEDLEEVRWSAEVDSEGFFFRKA